MADSPVSIEEREKRTLEALRKLHNETMAKLATLRKRQLDLYRRVSERIDVVSLKKGIDQLKSDENK